MKNLLQKTSTFYILSVFLSWTGMKALNNYFFSADTLGTGSILDIFCITGIFILFAYAHKIPVRTQIYGCLFGFLLSSALITGKVVYQNNSLYSFFWPAANCKRGILDIIGMTFVTGSIITLFLDRIERAEQTGLLRNFGIWKIFRLPSAVWTVIFFLSWLPCYLAYYPGIYSYDMDDLTGQALGEIPFTRFHPPLHTLIWKGCLFLQQRTGVEAITVYSLFQMLLLALVFTHVTRFLIQKRFNNWCILGTILFFAFNPVIALFSFIPTKDVCFAATFLLLSTELLELAMEPGNSLSPCRFFRFSIAILLCCLLRNNALYALVLFLPAALQILRQNRRTVFFVFFTAFSCFLFIDHIIYNALGIGSGNSREMLSVPIQQISNVVVMDEETLTEEEKLQIDQFIPYQSIKDYYNPRFADPVKQTFRTENFDGGKAEFVKLWLHLFIKYPGNYINAFLSLNLPYWYPDASPKDEYSDRKYIETFIYDYDTIGYTFERKSILPGLYEKYEKTAKYYTFQGVPVIANVFSLSMPFWMSLACCFLLHFRRKQSFLPLPILSLLLWLTFMAGPVSNFRYIFPIHIQYPLFLAAVFGPGSCNADEMVFDIPGAP